MAVTCYACGKEFSGKKGLGMHLRFCGAKAGWVSALNLKRGPETEDDRVTGKKTKTMTTGDDEGTLASGSYNPPLDPSPVLVNARTQAMTDDLPTSVSRSGRTRRTPRALKDFLPHSLLGLAPHLRPAPPKSQPIQPAEPPTPLTRVSSPVPPTVISTEPNIFGLYRQYTSIPRVDPEKYNSTDRLAAIPMPGDSHTGAGTQNTNAETPFYRPFASASVFRLLEWFYRPSSSKSLADLDRLVHGVILSDDFNAEDLRGFGAAREMARLDSHDSSRLSFSPADGWREGSVTINVPNAKRKYSHESAAPRFEISGIQYRPLLEIIRSVCQGPDSQNFHWLPHKVFHTSKGGHVRAYTDIYNSDAMLEEDARIRAQPRNPEDGPEVEIAILAVLLWSDSTHLANFGTASLWPIYMYFGNTSKYTRGKPTSFPAQHLAYIPSLPDRIQDFYLETFGTTATAAVLRFLKIELMQKIWQLLLDDDLVNAYAHGITITCSDGVKRRIFPRFFTYAADYPEKVLIACIKYLSVCPCPRCLIKKSQVPETGTRNDDHRRRKTRKDDNVLRHAIAKARELIFEKGIGVAGKWVQNLLSKNSQMPSQSAFSARLARHGFNIYPMLVVDLLHEFELGVWKAIFTHLLRILYARGNDQIQKLNRRQVDQHTYAVNESNGLTDRLRFREVPTFGNGTIRRFANNVSAMNKLAGRDFEDILQCIIPVIEGLLPPPHNEIVLDLLFELVLWHALAKLRIHTDKTLDFFQSSTKSLTATTRRFLRVTCNAYVTQELPKETAARGRRTAALAAKGNTSTVKGKSNSTAKKNKSLNLATYKYHALSDYPDTIRKFGTTDNYNTQIGEMEHRRVKRFYARTNKRNAAPQIAKMQRREALLHAMVSEDPIRSESRQQTSNVDPTPIMSPDDHHHIPDSQRTHFDLLGWLHQRENHPSVEEFVPRLKNHIMARYMKLPQYGEEQEFTDTELDDIQIVRGRVYKHPAIRVNYTTYDMRRAQDYINVNNHANVMVLAHEDDEDISQHPYWYARVLGIYHVNVRFGGESKPQKFEFLWVHWYGRDPRHRGGFETRRLHRIGLMEPMDSSSYGFLDPSDILRAVHLIPAFDINKTPHGGSDTDEQETEFYYVSMFVDRDMFMRHLGGGIGHKATEHIQLNTATSERVHENDTEAQQEDVDVDDTALSHPTMDPLDQCTLEDDLEMDSEGIDTDEEGDFGYGNSATEGSDAEQEDDTSEDSD